VVGQRPDSTAIFSGSGVQRHMYFLVIDCGEGTSTLESYTLALPFVWAI